MIVYQDGTLTVCGPSAVEVVRRDPVSERWCFRCRKRRTFEDVCERETGMSYYDPWWTRTCSQGHVDGDLFPGWSREGE